MPIYLCFSCIATRAIPPAMTAKLVLIHAKKVHSFASKKRASTSNLDSEFIFFKLHIICDLYYLLYLVLAMEAQDLFFRLIYCVGVDDSPL